MSVKFHITNKDLDSPEIVTFVFRQLLLELWQHAASEPNEYKNKMPLDYFVDRIVGSLYETSSDDSELRVMNVIMSLIETGHLVAHDTNLALGH
jgi:hypothetical protein